MTNIIRNNEEKKQVFGNIIQGLKYNNMQKVDILLCEHPDLLHLPIGFGSWLHECIVYNNLDALKYFLDKGIDINIRNTGFFADYTPLAKAADKGNIKIVKFLHENGGIFDTSEFLSNPLIAVINDGKLSKKGPEYFETAKYLIDNGLDVSIKYNAGKTVGMGAYEFALEWDKFEIADYIMKKLNETLGEGVYEVTKNPRNL